MKNLYIYPIHDSLRILRDSIIPKRQITEEATEKPLTKCSSLGGKPSGVLLADLKEKKEIKNINTEEEEKKEIKNTNTEEEEKYFYNCQELCENEGNCTGTGKLGCIIKIPQNETHHQGSHNCGNELHFCVNKCPNCGVSCSKILYHGDEHQASEHLDVIGNGKCNEICNRNNGDSLHTHKIECFGKEYCGENFGYYNVYHQDGVDYWECDSYWKLYNWTLSL